jgi:hypothetical protein
MKVDVLKKVYWHEKAKVETIGYVVNVFAVILSSFPLLFVRGYSILYKTTDAPGRDELISV